MNELLPAMTNERIVELAYHGALTLRTVAQLNYDSAPNKTTLHAIIELDDEVAILARLMDEYIH